jgi:hypothetical protein
VILQKLGAVQDATLDNDPNVVLLVVLGNIIHGEFLLRNGELFLLGSINGGGVRTLSASLVDGVRGGLTRRLGRSRGRTAPIDSDTAGGVGIDVERDLVQTRGGVSSSSGRQDLLEEVLAAGITGDATVDDAAQQRRTTETVGSVNTARNLTASVKTLEGFALLIQDLSLVIDLDATHGEVKNWLHERDVESVVDVERNVVEELFAVRVLLFSGGDVVIILEHLLEMLRSTANLLGEFLATDLLHEATARVVTGVEVKDIGRLAVENKTDGELILEHLAGDVITVAELVTESVAGSVEQETTLATERWSGQHKIPQSYHARKYTYPQRPRTWS